MKKSNCSKLFLILSLVLILTGCGGSSNEKKQLDAKSHAIDPDRQRELFHKDIDNFETIDSKNIELKDRNNLNGAYFKLFGGYTGQDLKNFISQRIRYVYGYDELVLIRDHRDNSVFPVGLATPEQRSEPGEDMTFALNVGAGVWAVTVVSGVPISLIRPDHEERVESSRIGVVQLGKHYADASPDFSEAYVHRIRQGIDLHEARHSDCVGGIPKPHVGSVRDPKDKKALARAMKLLSTRCETGHVQCPIGHSYEGTDACDEKPWGSYSVSWIYYETMTEDTSISFADRSALRSAVSDMKTRLLFNTDKMLQGKFGDPVLESKGVI